MRNAGLIGRTVAPDAAASSRTPRCAVVVPALDEEHSIAGVLAALPVVDRVIVVDNGSRDRTAAVARAAGATVVHEPKRGYGTAVQSGLRALCADPPDIVAILDADHADRPELLYELIRPIRDGSADLVLSDRTRMAEPGSLQPVQRFGNRLASLLIRGVTGHVYRDMGPFRAIRWTALERLAMSDPSWGWNVEMQIKAVRRGLRIVEIPMPYRKRTAGHSKISGTVRGSARAGARILLAVARYRAG